ncbi:synaptic plasticity regulator PANTS isoform X2 [Panulirus ornatus]|uniref:synaptic plasticity regulator PANTS isoform X2 n=1 Tax=Panulirus ornatus TaxID=150431 RepID=UPI003A84796A
METEAPIQDIPNLPRLAWLVRRCERYKEEYNDCTTIKAKFHQYFIHGETQDCSQWKADYKQCLNYRKHNDLESLSSVIESERVRRQERLKGHHANTIWEKRDSPPDDWNKPLPEYLQKHEEISYLSLKCKEQKEGKTSEAPLCTIS